LIVFLAMAAFASSTSAAYADSGSYKANMTHDLVRGLKNIVSAPLEIPVSFQEYHEKAGPPVLRQGVGILEGVLKSVGRLGSGIIDLFAAFIPGHQQGLPPHPETFF